MSDGLFPRRRPLSPLGGFRESREKYLEFKEKLVEEAQEKFETAYRDWDLPCPNDPRTPTPRWEMTKEEELHWRSLTRRFNKHEKYAVFTVTNAPVPEKPVDLNDLPRRYREPVHFLSIAEVDKDTEEEMQYTQLIRKEDRVGIKKSFRCMFKTQNVRPRVAVAKRRGYDEAFYEECSKNVLLEEPPKKIKEFPCVPTKGIEKEWNPSESEIFKKAKNDRIEQRKKKSKSGSPAIAEVLEKPEEQEVEILRERDPAEEEKIKEVCEWLEEAQKTVPEDLYDSFDEFC